MGNTEEIKTGSSFRFGDFVLEPERASLSKAGREIKLRPKVFDALRYLIENRGRLVPKEELIHALWPEAFVTDDSLVQCMVELRRALDDRSQEILKTVPRRGYIFSATVSAESIEHPVSSEGGTNALPKHHRVPVARTPLLGREREFAAVQQMLLDPAVRLVTLTGAGGSGKTRLGLELCRAGTVAFEDRVYFVALGSISDPAMVPATIAESVGIRETGGRPFLDVLKDSFQETEPAPVLLLLDNLEHILPASAIVVDLVEACPGLKVLVTSRSPLRVYGEHEFPVPPLALPHREEMDCVEALSANPSVRLFTQRAAAVKPDFELTADNASVIAEICSRLDGLPLAIELAAARVKMLPLSGILTRLQNPLQLLTAGPRDLPERQQTLRNAIDWSYGLLNEAEQKLLRRLSVFWGAWTLEGAEAVCNTKEDIGVDIFDLMSSLIDKSLVQSLVRTRGPGAEEPRFRMLETIREYAIERLQQSGEEANTKRAHAAYCLVLAEEGNPELGETERAAWLARCDIEYDDFRAALDWLFQTHDLDWGFRFCIALFRFWDMRERSAEGRDRLEHILQLAGFGYPRERAKICLFVGAFSTAQGDFAASSRFLEQSLAVYRELDDPSGMAISVNAAAILARDRGDYAAATINFEKSLAYWRQIQDQFATARCLHNLGNVCKISGDYERARMTLTEAMQIFDDVGDQVGAAWALNQLGDVAAEQGDLAAARSLYQRALAAFRGAGDRWGTARSLADLGTIASELGERANAYENFRESLEIYREHGQKRGMARVIEGLACLALSNGEPRQALVAVAAAARLRHAVSAPLLPADQSKLDQQLQKAWRQLGEVEGKKAWAEGGTMPLESAIQLALSGQAN